MTVEEWHAEGERRFGKDYSRWKFKCPSCWHVASVQNWKDAGAPEGGVAFSCIGRYTGATGRNAFKQAGGPCNYTGGGIFKINPITVIEPNGYEHRIFEFAPSEDIKSERE